MLSASLQDLKAVGREPGVFGIELDDCRGGGCDESVSVGLEVVGDFFLVLIC